MPPDVWLSARDLFGTTRGVSPGGPRIEHVGPLD